MQLRSQAMPSLRQMKRQVRRGGGERARSSSMPQTVVVCIVTSSSPMKVCDSMIYDWSHHRQQEERERDRENVNRAQVQGIL